MHGWLLLFQVNKVEGYTPGLPLDLKSVGAKACRFDSGSLGICRTIGVH